MSSIVTGFPFLAGVIYVEEMMTDSSELPKKIIY